MLRARRGMDQGVKTDAMLKGWFVHYNFLRPHSSLGGRTPAEVAGINLDLTNRWESLIDMATKWKAEVGVQGAISKKIGPMVRITV